jgi:NAD(P)-dependent dehydrogenase (short-subunit alcohol dehydrogenase family)
MNKTVVIIGGSTGIGKALVKKAAKEGCTVVCFSRSIDQMNQSFAEYSNVDANYLDLESLEREVFESVLKKHGPIDLLINNAGYLVNKPFRELSSEDLRKSFEVNAIGIMEVIKYSLPYLNKTSSHIVNISSMGAFQGSSKFAGLTAYSSSKAAICTFTEVFAEEYKNSTIKMNCLCLGAVQTEMLEKAFPGFKAEIKADEMASYILDFAIKQSQFLNGKIIPVSLTTP